MLNPSVIIHNYNKLIDMSEGTKFTVNENGYLIEGIPTSQKSFIAWVFGEEEDEAHKVINQTCQQLFDQVIQNHPSPLSLDRPQLARDRVKVKSLLEGVAKLGHRILLPQLEADLIELVHSPETLEARLAIRHGISPQPLNQTISGTYIMHNRLGKPWGIFKPKRQEVGGDKNPSWLVWATSRAEQWNIESGTGYLRECAAYQLDKERFSAVPLTVSTNFTHPVLDTSVFPLRDPNFEGSFQLFKDSCSPLANKLKPYEIFSLDSTNWFKKMMSTIYLLGLRVLFQLGFSHIPKDEIHKMAILDIRILNCDRHLGNCLVKNDTNVLYPIDHGLTLPNKAHWLRFEWKNLVQSRFPLSEQSLEYVKNLDPTKDSAILSDLGVSDEARERMKLSTLLLKEAAARGLTLYQISDLMQRKTRSTTYFEGVICHEVLNNGKSASHIIKQAIDRYVNLFV